MKRLLLVLLFLSLPVLARAQSSCDKPALSGTTTITTPTFLFAIGVPSTQPAPAGFQITVDGTATDVGALPSAPGTPPTNGEQCFNASVTVTGNGNHTVSTKFYTLDGGGAKQFSPASSPFVLSLGSPVPTAAPINHPR